MHLHHKTGQHRRDFTAVYECEHCRHQHTSHGYDDAYFHASVIPAMVCPECGKTAESNAPASSPDVPAGVTL